MVVHFVDMGTWDEEGGESDSISAMLDLRLWILELIMNNWQGDASFDFLGVVTRKIIFI